MALCYGAAMHVQFDTNTFGDVLENEGCLELLVDMAPKLDWWVSISLTALPEVLGMDDEHYQLSRARRILELRQRLGGRFFIARGWESLAFCELSVGIDSPLHLPSPEVDEIYYYLRTAVETQSRDAGRMFVFTKAMREYKRNAREMFDRNKQRLASIWRDQKITPRTMGSMLAKYTVASVPDWLVSGLVRDKYGRSRYQLRSIYARPKRFKAILGWSSLVNMVMFADIIPPGLISGHPSLGMLKRHDNDWYDAGVAASSAYCDVFVTHDKTLRQRCEFMCGKGMFHFRLTGLKELLGPGCP
ncbi:hypothetical protein [Corallococcus carmarthensis]|uniref:hypothetical protein n=1 Tax=Corallococcus carmarthensis TaxID=2316728 RepID=UPI0011C3B27C|nr:hypothetical protein [Corallococcus carmarthensis]